MKKWLIIVGALVGVALAVTIYLHVTAMPGGPEVSPSKIPPPVVVSLIQSNSPLRVFPTGGGSMLLILPDGTLWVWGETGAGNWPRAVSPTRIGTNCEWSQACPANNHSVAVRNDGTLWEWGNRLANSRFSHDPERVDSGTNWVYATAGDVHAVALKRDGTLWAWGENTDCELGIGAGPASTNLIKIGTNCDWTAVRAAGSFTLGLRANGTLWIWGNVSWYRSNPTGGTYPTPVQVSSDTNWAGFPGWQFASMRGQKNEAWNPTLAPPNSKTPISEFGERVSTKWITEKTAVSFVGSQENYEIRPDGTLWTSAYRFNNDRLVLPDNWRQIGKRTDWVSIWGWGTVIGLTSDGTVWTWGLDIGQEPILDLNSRLKRFKADILVRLGRSAGTWQERAVPPHRTEPRPLMRLAPAANPQTNDTSLPAK